MPKRTKKSTKAAKTQIRSGVPIFNLKAFARQEKKKKKARQDKKLLPAKSKDYSRSIYRHYDGI